MIVVEEGNEISFGKRWLSHMDEEEMLSYKGWEFPVGFAKMFFDCSSAKNISAERIYELIGNTLDEYPTMTEYSVKKYLKAEHNGKADLFLMEYPVKGNSKCAETPTNPEELNLLRQMFSEDSRFHGRIPQILPQIAATLEFYRECGIQRKPEEILAKFQLNPVRNLMNSGIPRGDAVNLFCFLPIDTVVRLTGHQEICEMVSSLITKGLQKKDKNFLQIAVWMAEHPDTNRNLLHQIYEEKKDLAIHPEMTVEAVYQRLSMKDSVTAVKKLEKAYKDCNFRLADCECLLRDRPTEYGRYRGRILKGDDPLQVMLGDLTNCCQTLGDAGESAMMYGLTNAHAGFWVLENKSSGKIYAQAEAWEWDENTLVLDNIEFANDAEIDQYKEAIGAYLLHSPYKNIIMGCGYNGLSSEARGSLRPAPEVTPKVTAYDIYVMSYEDDAEVQPGKDEDEVLCIPTVEKAKDLLDSGKVTYYDYLYSDVDDNKGVVYIKENGVVNPYFGATKEMTRDAVKEDLKQGDVCEQVLLALMETEEFDLEEEDERTI